MDPHLVRSVTVLLRRVRIRKLLRLTSPQMDHPSVRTVVRAYLRPASCIICRYATMDIAFLTTNIETETRPTRDAGHWTVDTVGIVDTGHFVRRTASK